MKLDFLQIVPLSFFAWKTSSAETVKKAAKCMELFSMYQLKILTPAENDDSNFHQKFDF